MTGERRTLDLYGLDDFGPRPVARRPSKAVEKAVDRLSAFVSREQADEEQINIRASAETLHRFRSLAKAERYRHGQFLEILMNAYLEQKKDV